jgi:hypothetical protein
MRSEHLFGTTLFPPFYQLSGLDTGATEYLKKARAARDKWDRDSEKGPWLGLLEERTADAQRELGFASLGSPLWKAYSLYKERPQIGQLFMYAAQKMNGSFEDRFRDSGFIAALSCRVGLSILPDSVLARELVAGGMAQLNYLSRDRNHAYVGYPSDPTLAEGAALIMNFGERKCLETLLKHVERSLVDIGLSGEVIARLLIIYAMDRMRQKLVKDTRSSGSPWAPGKVSDFFKALLLPALFQEMKRKYSGSPIWDGFLFVNHTVKLEGDMKLENLAYAISRGAMISGFAQQEAWDICIPVALPTGRMGMILVQVKNWKDSIGPNIYDGIFSAMHAVNILENSGRNGKADAVNSSEDQTQQTAEGPEVTAIEAKMSGLELASEESSDANSVADHEHSKRRKIDVETLYVLINFRQGQISQGAMNKTKFFCKESGDVFAQGQLNAIFQDLFEEPGALEDLALLLRPRTAREHLRLAETTSREQQLYDAQDHACTKCTL